MISHQSVLANVEIALALSGVSIKERRKRSIDALTKVGLKEHINKRPNQLSGGQMQRVAIARALVNDPEIILADEPTGALDSETSIQIMELLKEIAKDKLVIMVTHNPEIAKKYSTRIIELKDGLIIKDSNPCGFLEEKNTNKTISKTSMSLLTSLGLSFNNLRTKKGRTILTAFAGSIGIIGIALIWSLTTGVNKYISNMEKNSLSNFPISLNKNNYDFTKLFELNETKKIECNRNQLCSNDDITEQVDLVKNDITKKNNLEEFKKYIEDNDEIKDYVTEIQYGYNLDLQIYSTKNSNYTRINPNSFNPLGNTDIKEESNDISASLNTNSTPVFQVLLDNEEVLNSKYEVVAGTFPKEYNELVLVINKDNVIPDSILYALDIKDRKEISELLTNKSKDDKVEVKSTTYSYDEILNLSYKLILNTDYYKYEDGIYKDYSADSDYMKSIINNGLDVKIVGILRVKDDSTEANFVGYKSSLTEYVINNISKTDIYKNQTTNKDINVLTGEKFDGMDSSYESNCQLLGIADINDPDSINIYPKDFDSKQQVINLIENYNKMQNENGKTDLVLSYTDLIKTVVKGVTSVVNIVSYVLIGFVAISLIVSSIMISIITYVSVLERTKEIGILRAMGASKKDVSRVFKAETIIEGLIAGLIGIGIALLISLPINLIVSALVHIEKIASLPFVSAIFLILLSVVLNVLAGHIPSKMASKKDPVIALRSE